MSERAKGITAILISALGFSLMNLFIPLAGDINAIQKSFFRNIIAFIIAWVIYFSSKKDPKKSNVSIKEVPTKVWQLLILRSLLGTAGMWFHFYAVDHLLIADASVLNKLAPFCTLIFSSVFLKEKLKVHHFIAIGIAFLGVLFVVKPGFNQGDIFAYLIGVLGGVFAGAAYTSLRRLNQYNVLPPSFLIAFFSTFSTLLSLPYILLNYQVMTGHSVMILIMVGIMAALGQFGITMAYKFAPASEISVFDYSAIVFTGILGLLFLKQSPDTFSVIGYVLIIVSGYFNWYRNKSQS